MTDRAPEGGTGPWMAASPDPTAASSAAVEAATEVSRREINALREKIETRIDGMDQDRGRLWDRVRELPQLYEVAAQHLREELIQRDAHSREVITQRLNDLDTAAKLAAERIERIPADNTADAKALAADFRETVRAEHDFFSLQIAALKDVHNARLQELTDSVKWRDDVTVGIRTEITEKMDHLKSIHDKDLEHIKQQFSERDTRFDREADNAKNALAVALTSAKEQVALQTAADAVAAQKSETSFTKQFDQIGATIQSLEKSIDTRITELKERIDRSEGQAAGTNSGHTEARAERTEQRLSQSAIVSLIVAFVVVAGFVISLITILHKLGTSHLLRVTLRYLSYAV